MVNFAIFSNAKNHKKSFDHGIKEATDYINSLSEKYAVKYKRLNKLSEERKSNIDLLQRTFDKYNFSYKKPLVENSVEDIKQYTDDLLGQLTVSLASVSEEKRDEIMKDFLDVSAAIAKIQAVSSYIDTEGQGLVELANELHDVCRIPEKDSKEEKIIDFKAMLAKKKAEKEKELDIVDEEEGKYVSQEILDDIGFENSEEEKQEEIETKDVRFNDEISNEIFDSSLEDEAKLDEESIQNFFDTKFVGEEEAPVQDEEQKETSPIEVVDVELEDGSSLANEVGKVYGDSEYWPYIYNYNDANKGVIDRKSEESFMSVEDAVYDDEALSGAVVQFPTELVTFEPKEETEEEENEFRRVA
jgi:hypothetical protein